MSLLIDNILKHITLTPQEQGLFLSKTEIHHYKAKTVLYHDMPKLERFFRVVTENAFVANQERIMENLSLSAEECFEKFSRKYPSLIQQVSQKQIAPFIIVTPEFLARSKATS